MGSASSIIGRQEYPIEPRASSSGSVQSLEPAGLIGPNSACSAQRGIPAPYPTVLIATADPEIRQCLARTLRKDDYLVLEAGSGIEVLHVAKCHSRPIQVLLLHADLVGDVPPVLLRRFRPSMQQVMIENDCHRDDVSVAIALNRVRELLQQMAPRTR